MGGYVDRHQVATVTGSQGKKKTRPTSSETPDSPLSLWSCDTWQLKTHNSARAKRCDMFYCSDTTADSTDDFYMKVPKHQSRMSAVKEARRSKIL